MPFRETDMYPPVKKYLEAAGYTVTAEVNGADVTAVKADELLILELKRQFNVKLLFQALERQKITSAVYVVIPRPKRRNTAQFSYIKRIVTSLGLGLMTVAMDSAIQTVEVVIEPELLNGRPAGKTGGRKRRAMLLEIAGRSADANAGGSSNVRLMTAYRERCVKLACALYDLGPMTAKELINGYGCGGDSYDIMYRNHYGWFRREGRGVFGLTVDGAAAVESDGGLREIVDHYRQSLRGIRIDEQKITTEGPVSDER